MLIGWEIDYAGDQLPSSGIPDQQMTAAQYQASVKATAAVLRQPGRDASCAHGHRETSTRGKIDPSFIDLDAMRNDDAAATAGGRRGDRDISGDGYADLMAIGGDGKLYYYPENINGNNGVPFTSASWTWPSTDARRPTGNRAVLRMTLDTAAHAPLSKSNAQVETLR